jgi:cation transport regulator ChaB
MPRGQDTETDIPSTVARSDAHAQEIWRATHDSAVESYGEGERAHRTAFASLKHSYEKVGDHWEPKAHKGPSDERAAQPTGKAARGEGETHGGVDANATKAHLTDLARRLEIRGRSKMDKAELVEAIERENDRRTRQARGGR